MSFEPISARQEQIYDFLCTYTREHGYPPSVREIGTAVGLASPSTVHMHLKALEDAGYIKRDPNKPRALEIVGPGASDEPTSLVTIEQDLDRNLISLPVVGRVAAGMPILAEQNVEEMLSLPTSIVGDASSFILRVRGD